MCVAYSGVDTYIAASVGESEREALWDIVVRRASAVVSARFVVGYICARGLGMFTSVLKDCIMLPAGYGKIVDGREVQGLLSFQKADMMICWWISEFLVS